MQDRDLFFQMVDKMGNLSLQATHLTLHGHLNHCLYTNVLLIVLKRGFFKTYFQCDSVTRSLCESIELNEVNLSHLCESSLVAVCAPGSGLRLLIKAGSSSQKAFSLVQAGVKRGSAMFTDRISKKK